jgi:hypothetical protein
MVLREEKLEKQNDPDCGLYASIMKLFVKHLPSHSTDE